MNSINFEKKTAKVLAALGNPFRIKILLAIGKGEACVCHLEAVLNKRQAYISQHLMALRDAGLLTTRREGKYIYYRLSSPKVLPLIEQAAVVAGVNRDLFPDFVEPVALKKCECPHCESEKEIKEKKVSLQDSLI